MWTKQYCDYIEEGKHSKKNVYMYLTVGLVGQFQRNVVQAVSFDHCQGFVDGGRI